MIHLPRWDLLKPAILPTTAHTTVSIHHQDNKHILTMRNLILTLLLLVQLGTGATSLLPERKLVRRLISPAHVPEHYPPLPTTHQLTNAPLLHQAHIICRDVPGFHHANKGTIDDGIKYLRKHDPPQATLGHQPGGGWCSRVSCEKSAAIYACNDDEANDKVISLSAAADLAQAVLDEDGCVWKPSTGHVVLGQAFDDEGWNVIVGTKDGDSC